MKLTLVAILATILCSSVVYAEGTAYYDLSKALADGADAKKEAADTKADQSRQQAELDGLLAEAKKLDAACAETEPVTGLHVVTVPKLCTDASAKHQQAEQLFGEYKKQAQQRTQGAQAQTLSRIARIVAAVAKAKRLAVLVPESVAFYAVPNLDMTGEILRRLDAGEGKDDDQVRAENARLKAENARLVAEKAALTKPIAPAVPTPPPIQPLASKGK